MAPNFVRAAGNYSYLIIGGQFRQVNEWDHGCLLGRYVTYRMEQNLTLPRSLDGHPM